MGKGLYNWTEEKQINLTVHQIDDIIIEGKSTYSSHF